MFGGGGLPLPGIGGATTQKTSVSQSTNVSIANNPTIANILGDAAGFSPNVTGPATGAPSSSATSSGGDDGFGFLPGRQPSVPYRPNTGVVYGPNGQPVGLAQTAAGDSTLPLLLAGGAALLFILNND